MKKLRHVAFLIAVCSLVLSSCPNPWVGELITVTINLGGGGTARQVGWGSDNLNPGDLEHTVTLTNTGSGDVVTATVTEATTSTIATATAVITAGQWRTEVIAKLTASGAAKVPGTSDGDIYAVGIDTRNISASSGPIEVDMKDPTSLPLLSGTITFTAGGVNAGERSLSGQYIMNQELTASLSAGNNGTGTPTWVWKRNGTIIAGATNPNYMLEDADRGTAITVEVSFTGNNGDIQGGPLNVHPGIPITSMAEFTSIVMNQSYILVSNIGTVSAPVSGTYTGTFDGNGNIISLNITGSEMANAGLFSIIGSGSTVKNLRLTGTVNVNNTTMGLRAGALAGTNQGTIFNVSSNVNVSSTTGIVALTMGGLVGSSNRTIRNSYTTGNVTGFTTAASVMIGGIVGSIDSNTNNISFCWTSGIISGQAGTVELVGGIVGNSGGYFPENLIENCVALNSNLISAGYDNNNKLARRIAALWGATPTLRNNYAYVPGGGGTWDPPLAHNEPNGADFPNPNNIANWTNPSGPGWTIYNVPIIDPAHPDAPTEINPWWWLDGPDRPRLWFESGVNEP